MSTLARWWPRPAPLRWPWQRRVDLESDHGHRPYAAWEAEFSAYARLRTGVPIEVLFGLSAYNEWGDKVHLARPPAALSAAEAFRQAELELEHVLVHFRQGAREIALYWHTWTHPVDPVNLPWPPWDQVALPGRIVRQALLEGVPGFEVPAGAEAWPGRQRDAAQWIAAAWADGVHRAREVAERPGMLDRLPAPPPPGRASPWQHLLFALASGEPAGEPALVNEALGILTAAGAGGVDDPAAHTHAVIEGVSLLSRRGAIPPAHKQRPPWLRPLWGRWRRAVAVQRALAQFVRSPTSAEMAAATARARTGRTLGPAGGGLGALPGALERSGLARRQASEPDAEAAQRRLLDDTGQENQQWGVSSPPEQADARPAGPSHEEGGSREGQGQEGAVGAGLAGAGPGTLGALHVIEATPSDRAAYWQLRAALAPDIERLIERLRAASGHDDAAAPRRFQRAGRLDRSRLAAALSGREAIFIRHLRRPEPAHALTLLLDCSASMTTRAKQLREAAILVEAAAAAVGARVSAFTFGPAWERMEPLAEGAPLVALGREVRPHGGTPFGPAVVAAAEWLARQPFEQRRLWVFTDGQWSARDRAEDIWRPELLKDTVVWILAEQAPDPPHPAMRIAAIPTLANLVQQAPAYFWPNQDWGKAT